MLRPVNKMPPEILSRIARYVPDEYAVGTKQIIPLTHVCRYWRESIVSALEHWTRITCCQTTHLTALSLMRSKAAPLQLSLRTAAIRRRGPGFCDLIRPYIQNIETLLFDDLGQIEDLTRTLPNFPRSTPNLRSLELRYMQYNCWDPTWDLLTDPFELFPDTLRSLSLDHIPLYPSFLRLKTLTELSLDLNTVHPPLDTLLDFLEENRSLQSVDLTIIPKGAPTPILERRVAIMDQLRHLSITSSDVIIARTLISNVSLRRGAHLGITFRDSGTRVGLRDILSGVSLTHLSNLPSPTFMECDSCPLVVRLVGPNGSFSYTHGWSSGTPFALFPMLPLANLRELRLVGSSPYTEFHPPSLPALETLAVQYNTNVSRLFSTLFPSNSSFPSLTTLGFLNCNITEEFMKRLSGLASARKRTASAQLHRVVIVHRDGKFPRVASINKLKRRVPIVDVQLGEMLPADLT